ncbi:MAG: HNH endonuclease, partial [Crocinitomicaceae bacterium]|nr:HNH endonuclease [Crocinitomicaceae bacterium]
TSVPYIQDNDSTYTLQLGGLDKDEDILAYNGEDKIGKLTVKVYEELVKEVYLISVNGASIPGDLEESLNEIYAQGVVSFNVHEAEEFNGNTWDIDEDNKLKSPSEFGILNRYSDEMDILKDTYFAYNSIDDEAIYLFFVEGFKESDQAGFMPRGKKIGFIKAGSRIKTAPHEIGHGEFFLKHTFPKIEQETTANLMDYSSGTKLTAAQWDWMREIHLNIFDNEAENQLITESDILGYYNDQINFIPANSETAYPLLDGTPMRINGVSEVAFEKYGRVARFKVGGETYHPVFLYYSGIDKNYFLGYYTLENHNRIMEEVLTWNDAGFEFASTLRFEDFISVEDQGDIYTESLEMIWGTYVDCYSTFEHVSDGRESVTDYLESKWWHINKPKDFGLYLKNDIIGGSQCANFGSYQINSGPCDGLFVQLLPLVDETKGEGDELAELVNYLNENTSGKSFYFYAEFTEKIYTSQKYFHSTVPLQKVDNRSNDETVEFFRTFEIFTLESFHDYFPVISEGDDAVDIVFSKVDLWEGINENYNVYSADYTSFPIPHIKDWDPQDTAPVVELMDYINELYEFQASANPDIVGNPTYDKIPQWTSEVLSDPLDWLTHKLQIRTNTIICFHLLGLFELYKYDMMDLIARRQIQRFNDRENFFNVIIERENAGQATSIFVRNTYDQYYAQYDTDCAFFMGLEYMKMYAEYLFEPALLAAVMNKMTRMVGSFRNFKSLKNIDDVLKRGSKQSSTIISNTLASKLDDISILESWLSKNSNKIDDVDGLLQQLDNSIGERKVLETLEDGQGRFVTVVERPGQSNLVPVIHKDVNGNFKLTEFNPAYNPSLNPSIPVPVSSNKLVPDYSGTSFLHPLNQGRTIKIKMTGRRNGRNGDFAAANEEMKKIDPSFEKPNDYTWHHLDDFNPVTGECTMQLVKSSTHNGLGVTGMQHSGSVAQWKAYYLDPSTAPNGLFYKN